MKNVTSYKVADLNVIKKYGQTFDGTPLILSEITLVNKSTPQQVIFKKLKKEDMKDKKKMESVKNQVLLISKLKHPNICDFFGVVKEKKRIVGQLTLFCKYGNLMDFLVQYKKTKQVLPFDEKVRTLLNIAQALKYLHKFKIVIKNLNPEIILVSSFLKKRLDVKLSLNYFGMMQNNKMEYSKIHIAPEVTKGGKVSRKSDIFSLGMIIWEVMNMDFHPFSKDVAENLAEKIANDPKMRPKIDKKAFDYNKLLIKLMKSCWSGNDERRGNAAFVVKQLKKVIKGEDLKKPKVEAKAKEPVKEKKPEKKDVGPAYENDDDSDSDEDRKEIARLKEEEKKRTEGEGNYKGLGMTKDKLMEMMERERRRMDERNG